MVSQARKAYWALIFAIMTNLSVVPGGSAHGDTLDEKSRAVLDSWLANVMQSIAIKIEPKVVSIDGEIIPKVFPSGRFFGVYLPRWPVAIRPPRELSYETVVYVRQGESLEPIRDEEALRSFLAQSLSGIEDEPGAQAAVLASLRLAEALAKGGPYQVGKPEFAVEQQGKKIVATAQATVHEPGRGQISISMEFSPGGKISSDAIKIDDRTRPGPPS